MKTRILRDTCHAQKRDDAAGTGQGHHAQTRCAHQRHQPRAGVADGWRTGIADKGHTLSLLQTCDHLLRSLGLIVFMHGQQWFFRAGGYAVGAQQGLRVAGVFTGNGINHGQYMQSAQADIGQIANRRGNHIQCRFGVMLRARSITRSSQGGAPVRAERGARGSIVQCIQCIVPKIMSTLLKQPAAMAKKLAQTIIDVASAKPVGAVKTSKAKGDVAEDVALAYLQAAGLKLLERNYRTPGRGGGEIDLIMRDKDETLVFVEVRQRSGDLHGGAAASIGATKRKRIVFAARFYLLRLANPPACRFDVVLVEAQITWLKAAFDAS